MKSKLILIGLIFLTKNALAHNLPIKYSKKLNSEQISTLEKSFEEVSSLMPEKLKESLPDDIEIAIEKLTNHQTIPSDLCSPIKDKNAAVKPFVYGSYNYLTNALILNTAVINELKNGREKSVKINCQHKNIYDQAIATIIHELTHAYDLKNKISNQAEYIHKAGFKKGIMGIKNKNTEAMRSVDPYELTNIKESFAVNMEYFAMDPEFACRKPLLFKYYKNQFGIDPYPQRDCEQNHTIMMSTQQGYFPMKLDPKRVYRIDYLMAAPGKDMSSGFGHSMFRIVMCAPDRIDPITGKEISATPMGKKCLEDKLYHLVLSYRANVEDATLNYMKGILGGYPSMLFILSFADVLDEYNRDELRDVVSYPLNLNQKDKEAFVLKAIEEHWNYRGSYKFFTNNCAVESYDLLTSTFDLSKSGSVTPKGVLEDLEKLSLLTINSSENEIFKAKSEQLLIAYQVAYKYRKVSEKDDKKNIQKFISESDSSVRMNAFAQFRDSKSNTTDSNSLVSGLKQRVIRASSFSVLEQQILRTKSLELRKQIADKVMNSKDEKIKNMVNEKSSIAKQKFSSLSSAGYGIPLLSEIESRENMQKKSENVRESMKEVEAMIREFAAEEFKELELISANIETFNKYSLEVRKQYRAQLETYIVQVIQNLAQDSEMRAILIEAAEGNSEAILQVRELIGKDLVTEKEILNTKLSKIILSILNA